MFAVAMTLVVLISAGVLLWQYRTGALLIDDGETSDGAQPSAPEKIAPVSTLHIDHAA